MEELVLMSMVRVTSSVFALMALKDTTVAKRLSTTAVLTTICVTQAASVCSTIKPRRMSAFVLLFLIHEEDNFVMKVLEFILKQHCTCILLYV